jgi:molybdate/tungstate transport system substrate-binding protein
MTKITPFKNFLHIKNFRRFFCFFLSLLLLTSCAHRAKTPLIVYAAGSLSTPLRAFETAFEQAHPDVDIYTEHHGSNQVVRHATELNEAIDIMLVADHTLIPVMMYTHTMPDSDLPYADWTIQFAANRMALAYTENSRYADEITSENWYEILSRGDVRIGLADPRFDASGYRTLMLIKLAEKHYQRQDIFSDIFSGQFNNPIRDLDRPQQTTILVPEILSTRSSSRIYLRGSSIQLLSLLESGDIDYAFEYQSVIEQHGLREISLPDPVNMGSANHLPEYEQVQVLLDFQRFATVKPEFKGEVITYGLTIPANAPNPELAAEYIQFLFSDQGRAIMNANHHPLLDPATVDRHENLPPALQPFAAPGE